MFFRSKARHTGAGAHATFTGVFALIAAVLVVPVMTVASASASTLNADPNVVTQTLSIDCATLSGDKTISATAGDVVRVDFSNATSGSQCVTLTTPSPLNGAVRWGTLTSDFQAAGTSANFGSHWNNGTPNYTATLYYYAPNKALSNTLVFSVVPNGGPAHKFSVSVTSMSPEAYRQIGSISFSPTAIHASAASPYGETTTMQFGLQSNPSSVSTSSASPILMPVNHCFIRQINGTPGVYGMGGDGTASPYLAGSNQNGFNYSTIYLYTFKLWEGRACGDVADYPPVVGSFVVFPSSYVIGAAQNPTVASGTTAVQDLSSLLSSGTWAITSDGDASLFSVSGSNLNFNAAAQSGTYTVIAVNTNGGTKTGYLFTVNVTPPDPHCNFTVSTWTQLIDSVTAASTAPACTKILVSVGGTLTAPSGNSVGVNLTDVTGDIAFVGTGNSNQVVDLGGNGRFLTDTGTSTHAITVRNLNIQGGKVPWATASGSDATAQSGGAIYVSSAGALNVETSTIYNNVAAGDGGGIRSETITVTGSTIDSNTAGSGGGIHAYGAMTVQGSQISRNQALSGDGGGLYAEASVIVRSSLLETNTALSGQGGGVMGGGDVNLESTSVVSNAADSGGGIAAVNGSVSTSSSQFKQNSAGSGSGVYALNARALSVWSSTFDANTASGLGSVILGSISTTIGNSTFHRNSGASAISVASNSSSAAALALHFSTFFENVSSGASPATIHLTGTSAHPATLTGIGTLILNPDDNAGGGCLLSEATQLLTASISNDASCLPTDLTSQNDTVTTAAAIALSALTANGSTGPQTMMPGNASVAVGFVTDTTTASSALGCAASTCYDERGVARVKTAGFWAGAAQGSVASAPSAPTNLHATAGNTSVTITWTASAGATSYTVTLSPSGGSCTVSGTGASCAGLTNGISYTVSVVARNANGGSTAVTTTVTPATGGNGNIGNGNGPSSPAPVVIPDPPQTASISGTSTPTGSTNGGNAFAINGNFGAHIAAITVGGRTLDPSQWSLVNGVLTITMPAGTAGTVPIQIFNGQVPLLAPIQYTYADGTASNSGGSTGSTGGSGSNGTSGTGSTSGSSAGGSSGSATGGSSSSALIKPPTTVTLAGIGVGNVTIPGAPTDGSLKVDASIANSPGILSASLTNGTLLFTVQPGFSGKTSVPLQQIVNGVPTLVQVPVVVSPITPTTAAAVSAPVPVSSISSRLLQVSTTISWSASPNATGYRVIVDGKDAGTATGTSLTLRGLLGPDSRVQVVPLGNDGTTGSAVQAIVSSEPVAIATSNFASGSSALSASTKRILDQVVALVKTKGFTTISLSGHTDNVGSKSSADWLSAARSKAVRAYLANKLGDAITIVTSSHGDTMPVASNANAAGRAANRRVDISVS